MVSHFPLSDDQLLSLAPRDLPLLRQNAYLGDGSSASMGELPAAAQAAIRGIYDGLLGILDLYAGRVHPSIGDLRAMLARTGWDDRISAVRGMSLHTTTPALGQVLHDLRGGSLQALSIQMQMLDIDHTLPLDMERIYLLTRDHLKIMRNCLPDLDLPRTERDLAERAHGVNLLVEKWQQAEYRLPDSAATVLVDARYDGTVADRCVEFAALDRVLYNLMNNATRHSAGDTIDLCILPLAAGDAGNLRFVLANQIAPPQRAALEQRFGDRWSDLFRGGFTFSSSGASGHGIGLAICAELVANAYGLRAGADAIAGGYVGARPHDDLFIAWFHWPIAAP